MKPHWIWAIAALIAVANGLPLNAQTQDRTSKVDTPASQDVPPALNFKMKSIDGKEVNLADYAGDVVVIVNTASRCGLTPQYAKLQALHEEFGDQGLRILGFPCNQFGGQEPGTEEQIEEFCQENYGVQFDMFSKVEVNGPGSCELYKYLTGLKLGPDDQGPIAWNFAKFVIGRDGKPIARFSPRTTPDSDDFRKVIVAALEKK